MIVAIYRNTLEGLKICSGEYFEHAGYKFCITVAQEGKDILVYAIEYTTGYDAIPPKKRIKFDPKKDRFEDKIEEAKNVLLSKSEADYEKVVQFIKACGLLRDKFPINQFK